MFRWYWTSLAISAFFLASVSLPNTVSAQAGQTFKAGNVQILKPTLAQQLAHCLELPCEFTLQGKSIKVSGAVIQPNNSTPETVSIDTTVYVNELKFAEFDLELRN